MKLTKQDKKTVSKKLSEELASSGDVFFTAFQGLKFKDIEALRGRLVTSKARFRVVRNSIMGHALKAAELEAAGQDLLKGPTAVVMLNGSDLVSIAKVLAGFSKEFPALKIKGGFSVKKWMTMDECKKLAVIGSREELLAGLAGRLYSCVAQIAGVLEAPARDLVFVLQAVEEKKKKEGPAAGGAASPVGSAAA
ncbi:MAG: 50S ribosomal protein L10 [bacterium]